MRQAARVIVSAAAATVAFLLADLLLSGVQVKGAGPAILAGVVTGILNVGLWPLLVRLALPVTVLTLGLAALPLNGAIVLGVGALLQGVEVDGLPAGIAVALLLTVVGTLVTSALGIDDDERVARHLQLRAVRGQLDDDDAEQPTGVIFLEIDGLSHAVLRRALRDGNAPTLAGWVGDGTHRLVRWETDLSSQTAACQAGLLHGNNEDIPAFRWWDKERAARVVTMRPPDARRVEQGISDGRGLLHVDGGSRGNVFSGDAPHALLTASRVLEVGRAPLGRDYLAYFASPFNLTRTLALAIADMVAELRAAVEQRRRDVRPRIQRGPSKMLTRAWLTVVARDLQVESVLADAFAGRPVVYATFLGYDELAHISGIERPDALTVLRGLDAEIRRIAEVVSEAPRRYEIVVLSDHGQSQGATFSQRYDQSLEALVRETCGLERRPDTTDEGEALGQVAVALTEAAQTRTLLGRLVKAATRNLRVEGAVRLGRRRNGDGEPPDVSVMGSGNLGLISFPELPGRVTLEDIEERYPRLVPALRSHPGIRFLMVRSAEQGAVVLGENGLRRLGSGEVEGEDPLAPYSESSPAHLARTSGFANCPDIVVNSRYWFESDEVAAFEELVGSHGGLGGPQSFPFMLAPESLPLPDEPLVGAERMHGVLRGWLVRLGHEDYAEWTPSG